MSALTKEQMIKELMETDKKIKDITGTKATLFRPPFWDYNDLLIQTARELNYNTIQWDIDSLDWKELGVEPVIDIVVNNIKSGSIVLFHNNAKYIKEYLPRVIQRLQEKGFEIVPLSKLIYMDNFRMSISSYEKDELMKVNLSLQREIIPILGEKLNHLNFAYPLIG